MTTVQLEFLVLEDPKPIPQPSKKHQETTEPEPEEEPEPEAIEEEEVDKPRISHSKTSEYVNIKTWGVRDTNGDWVTIPGDPDTGPMDYRQIPRSAENLTHREALEVFEKHPYAFQLIEGCDVWACLSDEPEVFVVRKEKKNVPAPEAVQGTGTVVDGPGHDETSPSPPSEVTQGAA